MNKIKVLHIITRVANGGADENTLFTINGLNKNEYDIDLLAGSESEKEILERISLKSDIDYFKIDSLVRDISLHNDIRALFEIYKIIKENNYDIVHTHIAKAGVLGRLAAKMAGVPHIIHGVHGITFPDQINIIKRELFKNIERFCGLFTDKFITVGEDMKQKYIQARVGKPDEYITIRSGMELSQFINAADNDSKKIINLKNEIGLKNDDLIIGMVSKLEKRKGYKYYLRVAKKVVESFPNVKFLIIGNGPEYKRLVKKTKKMNLDKNIIFTGYRTDIADVFSILDVKVLTSLWEGLPRVLVQAAAVAKPIVTFDVDGAWEIVEEDKNGFIVPMRDIEAMTNKLKLLIEDKRLRERMGEFSQEKVSNAWTIENMVKETDKVYKNLIDK